LSLDGATQNCLFIQVLFPQIKQAKVTKLLGVTLSERLHFDDHVLAVVEACSQRMYLLKLLRDQGLPLVQLNTIFQALIILKILNEARYANGFLSAYLTSQNNGLLKRCFKYGYCLEINTSEDLIESANCKLFKNLQNHQHCLLDCYLQQNHIFIISGLKDKSTTSRATLQNYIGLNVPSSHVANSNVNLSFCLLNIVCLSVRYVLHYFNSHY